MNQSFSVFSPTRVDLAGGTLDIWPLYCLVSGAKTINCSLSLRAITDFETTPQRGIQISLKSATGETASFKEALSLEACRKLHPSLAFPAFVVSEYLRFGFALPEMALAIHFRSEAPLRSGLGGSSALCVALLRGLGRLSGQFTDLGWQWLLLNCAKDIEAAYLGVPTGTQDYLASLFGGLKSFSSQAGRIIPEEYPTDVFAGLRERALVLFSGEMHASGLSNWEIIRSAMEQNDRVLQGLRQIRETAEQLDSELRGHVSWKHIGAYLTEEWQIRKAAFQVNTPRLDEILSYLESQKVLGAKVCGAAQGGSLLVLCDPLKKKALADACRAQGIQPLDVELGSRPVHIETR